VTIPIEFHVNGRPSSVNASTAKKNIWKAAVKAAAQAALGPVPNPPHDGEVTVKFFFFPATQQYTDVDNGIKHTLDAISPPILANDRTVLRVIAERFAPTPGSSLIVPVGMVPALANALMTASGQATGGIGQFATAIKIEAHTGKNGALW
jgi:hypothetical protein